MTLPPSDQPEAQPLRIVFFNRVYAPDEQATAVLLTDLCRRLAALGKLAVAVVTDVPGPDAEKGVRFFRPAADASARRRGGRLGSYLRYYLRACRAAWRVGPDDRPVIWTDPPMLDAVLGTILSLRGVPFYVTVQDLYPQIFGASGFLAFPPLLAALRALQAMAYRRARRIICISEDTRLLLAARGYTRTAVIENWDPLAGERRPAAASAGAAGPLRVLYSGNLGRACDVRAFAGALERLAEPEAFEFIFRGGGTKRPYLAELARRWPQIKLADRLPLDRFKGDGAAPDVHLILMPAAFYGLVYPSKLYPILGSGTPVCASVPQASVMYGLVKASGAGRACAAEDPSTLAAALTDLARLKRENPAALAAMGDAARRWAAGRDGATAAHAYAALIAGDAA
jgi:hypothetical protein